MDDFCVMFWIVIIIVVAVFIFTSIQANIQDKADRAENKARSEDYIYKRKENPNVIGGTNLDRFFIECVLSGRNNFSSKKNISKAELLADKYNLLYPVGIEALYERALKAHMVISNKIYDDNLDNQRKKELSEYNELTKYSEFYGRDKKKAMLLDRLNKANKEAASLDEGAQMLLKSGQQDEHDWATWGGVANGIAGVGAGVSTAIDIQAQNAKIRAQNEANMKAAMPMYVAAKSYSSKKLLMRNLFKHKLNI